MDDNPQVLAVAARVLGSVPGAAVTACSRPGDAVRAFMQDPASFELLVTDFDMPEMDGMELARRLTGSAAGLRVLLMTGSLRGEFQPLRAEVHLVLPKPFTPEMLLGAADRVLGRDDLLASHSGDSIPATVRVQDSKPFPPSTPADVGS